MKLDPLPSSSLLWRGSMCKRQRPHMDNWDRPGNDGNIDSLVGVDENADTRQNKYE